MLDRFDSALLTKADNFSGVMRGGALSAFLGSSNGVYEYVVDTLGHMSQIGKVSDGDGILILDEDTMYQTKLNNIKIFREE